MRTALTCTMRTALTCTMRTALNIISISRATLDQVHGAHRLLTEPRTTAMADPLTPPAQGSAEKRGAPHVAETPVSMQIGYYNIAWTDAQLSGRNHEWHREQLGRDCARAFESNDLAMLCLCQVGNNKLDENVDAHLGNSPGFQDKYPEQNVNIWLEQVIQEFCTTSTDLQACVLGPYAIMLNKHVCCFETSPTLTRPLVSCPGANHTYRRAVHSVIEVLPHGPLIEVWVHHAPSSKERTYTPLARAQTLEYFFKNMSSKSIVGGNLNVSNFGIKHALRTWCEQWLAMEIDQLRNGWQIHMLPEATHGDLALSRGLTASQIGEPHIGRTSKYHELVVVQISLANLPPHKRPSSEPSNDVRGRSVARTSMGAGSSSASGAYLATNHTDTNE